MAETSPAIETRNLVIRFGDFTAVDGVSFKVRRGEIFGFLGANGAGKTTTIRALCGLLEPTSGEVRVAERLARAVMQDHDPLCGAGALALEPAHLSPSVSYSGSGAGRSQLR